MNIEIMRKHYERTPKETLINVLVASREQVDKLQKRNKELKQEKERLKELCDKYEEEHKTTFEEWKKTINIISELEKRLEVAIEDNKKEYSLKSQMAVFVLRDTLELIEELKGSDKE